MSKGNFSTECVVPEAQLGGWQLVICSICGKMKIVELEATIKTFMCDRDFLK